MSVLAEMQRLPNGSRVEDSQEGKGTVMGTALVQNTGRMGKYVKFVLDVTVKFDSGISRTFRFGTSKSLRRIEV